MFKIVTIYGYLISEAEPAWEVILDLKDIVKLVVVPVHCDESVALHLCQKYPDLTTVTLAMAYNIEME